jgi:hypothetical protein
MNNQSDVLLHALLKNWVKRQLPPRNGRACLLQAAARATRNKSNPDTFIYRVQYNSYPFSYANEWAQQLFSWINENSFQVSLKARLI